jgi:hypothetical protein
VSQRPTLQISTAVLVYLILLFSLQIFLLVIAVEGFLDHDPGLAWSATAISVVLAGTALLLYRYLQRG